MHDIVCHGYGDQCCVHIVIYLLHNIHCLNTLRWVSFLRGKHQLLPVASYIVSNFGCECAIDRISFAPA